MYDETDPKNKRKVYEGLFTYHTIYSFGRRGNFYGPAFTIITRRHVISDDWLFNELKQHFLLKIPGYRPRILYGINCC